jgi:hypothetical protein
MTQTVLPILAPTSEAVAELLAAARARGLCHGHAYLWCHVNRVFAVLILEAGEVVHWQLEPAPDQAAADALQARYAQAARGQADVQLEHAAESFPREFRAMLERAVGTVLGRRSDH